MISIIGSGKVGSAVAFLAASESLDDIVLVNRTKLKAVGEALDIANAIPEGSEISILGTDDFSKTKGSEVVIITASTGVYLTGRTELLPQQADMIKSIAKKIKEFTSDSKILMVSNPLDVLTYIFQKEENFSRERVIGIASSLDSSRLRYLISRELDVNQSEIQNALVLGEHGNSMIPIFSTTQVNQKPVLDLLSEEKIEKISKDLRDYWVTLRQFKARSVFGISKQVYDVSKAILKNETLSIPGSVLLNGEFGISDVCIGVPILINNQGLVEIQEIPLSNRELNLLQQSANIIKKYIQSC